VDVSADVSAKLAAVRAHASQMDNAFFSQLPENAAAMLMGQESFIRVRDSAGAPLPEVDLFAGLR
jgi:LmbE family N-acetylglucosaminyl deacetylase